MNSISAKIAAISRHRLTIDGDGVTTLVVFAGCPLCCRYCLNPQTLVSNPKSQNLTPVQLYEKVNIDSLYFIATGGGVTFGGGEPCMHPDFIYEFRELCGPQWQIRVETSLNIPSVNLIKLLNIVDQFIIDVKDTEPAIYTEYSHADNQLVLSNLKLLAEAKFCDKCIIRLPLIPGYNTDANRQSSHKKLNILGFNNFDYFNYKIKENPLWHEANKHVKF
ncbi:MAG: radical SAM protein [Muribaculaceae bacterium]|nr:radical SAM protein [Muribaculaceae bacterium]